MNDVLYQNQKAILNWNLLFLFSSNIAPPFLYHSRVHHSIGDTLCLCLYFSGNNFREVVLSGKFKPSNLTISHLN